MLPEAQTTNVLEKPFTVNKVFDYLYTHNIEKFLIIVLSEITKTHQTFTDLFNAAKQHSRDAALTNDDHPAPHSILIDENRDILYKKFKTGFIDMYQKYNSFVINVYYNISKEKNIAKNRYHKFLTLANDLLGNLILLKTENKNFGKQHVHCVNVNQTTYGIVYNNHSDDKDHVKIILLPLYNS